MPPTAWLRNGGAKCCRRDYLVPVTSSAQLLGRKYAETGSGQFNSSRAGVRNGRPESLAIKVPPIKPTNRNGTKSMLIENHGMY